jgi:hypothetical protein
MNRLYFIVLLLLSGMILPVQGQDFGKGEWISLFNGKDLEDWIIKFTGHELNENYKNTFRVEEGLLKVCYDQYEKFNGEFGHIFYKDKFSKYKIRLEYRFTGKQVKAGPEWGLLNSGVMLHSQAPETMRKDQNFPVSIEAQFLADDGSGNRPTGNVCTPGTHVVMNGKLITEHCISTSTKTFPPDHWIMAEIEVHGDSLIRHLINGEVVCEYEKPQLDESDPDAKKLINDGRIFLSEGYIALQAETHPVEFRKIEIMILEK